MFSFSFLFLVRIVVEKLRKALIYRGLRGSFSYSGIL